jgi:hypothetical protein
MFSPEQRRRSGRRPLLHGALAAAVLGRLARRASRPRRAFLVAVVVPPVARALPAGRTGPQRDAGAGRQHAAGSRR